MNNTEYDMTKPQIQGGVTGPFEKQIILAVDDKPELLTAVVEGLRDNYTVLAVTSGESAIKVIEKYTPALFLLDIEMPNINGLMLAKLIRAQENFKKTPIIFLTAKGTRTDVITSVQHGGNDYIIKPVGQKILLDKIRKYLG